MREADSVTVLDTGSEDETASLLRSLGAAVFEEKIEPWRFDTARNRSLELVPEEAEVCVCTDLDEVFRPGWRAALERAWVPGTTRARYRYTWSFTPEGREGVVFYIEKAHSRHGWRWTHPVHEILHWEGTGETKTVTAEGVQLDHHADEQKSRAQYLPLLELSVREDPEDDRNMHYLGREYMFCRRWDDCIRTLTRHLAMPTATWRDERCASLRFLARAYRAKGDAPAAESALLRAAAEAPWLREPWVELAAEYYRREDWEGVCFCTERALAIKERGASYICEPESWGALPHDLRSIGLYKTGRLREARDEARLALALAPEDERIAANIRYFDSVLPDAEA